jgi:superfamily II DNA or RNA helicase
MIKARVSGMVWLPKSEIHPSVPEHLRKKLLIVPRKFGNYGDDDVKPTAIKCWSETPDEFGVPRAYWFETARGKYEYEWDVSFGEQVSIASKLRHEGPYIEQAVILEKLLSHFQPVQDSIDDEGHDGSDKAVGLGMGGIFQADPGFGKTNVALELIRRVGVTTVVLVHKEFLLKQWVRRAEKWLPGVKVGVCQGPKCDFKGKDIVIAMVESLALEDGTRYPAEFYAWPGMVIVDEVHRIGAPTWSPIPELFSACFRLGLSATPRRKDGADVVFWWHIGGIITKAETEMPKPRVRMIQIPKPFNHPPLLSRQESNDAVVITLLAKMTARNWKITQETLKALRGPAKRKVMVLSERLDHLRRLEKELMTVVRKDPVLSKQGVTTGFYVGEWFTGDVTPKLAPKHWPMEGDGRDRAIKLVYTSISRRKQFSGEIGKRFVLDEEGHLCIDENGSEAQEKTHTVFIDGADMNGILGENDFVANAKVRLILQDLTDDEILNAAVWFNIAQKVKEKTKPTTDEEQFEAERSRVIYATYQMCSEGVDIPAIDTEVLATPVSDVTQTAGRERRHCFPDDQDPGKCEHFCPWRAGECQAKPVPIIADIVDIGYPLCSKRERWRKQWYWSSEFKVAEGA